MFREEFDNIAQQMRLELEKTRSCLSHAGDKGSANEETLRQFLRDYLPRNMAVGEGEVIDRAGNRSNQTDIVILTSDHPATYKPGIPGRFFVEGVAAAGEVKTTLKADEFKKTIDKARKFKQLQADQSNIYHLASHSGSTRYSIDRPYFLFAYESAMSTATVGQMLIDECHKEDKILTDTVDAVFILDKVALVNFGDGTDCLTANTNGRPWLGWHHPEFFHPPLLGLMCWLSAVMPRELRFNRIILPYLMAIENV